MCRAMGAKACAKARDIFAAGWVSNGGERQGDLVTSSACQKILCSYVVVAVALGPDGRMWAAVMDGERVFYGEPPPEVRTVLQREFER